MLLQLRRRGKRRRRPRCSDSSCCARAAATAYVYRGTHAAPRPRQQPARKSGARAGDVNSGVLRLCFRTRLGEARPTGSAGVWSGTTAAWPWAEGAWVCALQPTSTHKMSQAAPLASGYDYHAHCKRNAEYTRRIVSCVWANQHQHQKQSLGANIHIVPSIAGASLLFVINKLFWRRNFVCLCPYVNVDKTPATLNSASHAHRTLSYKESFSLSHAIIVTWKYNILLYRGCNTTFGNCGDTKS